MPLEISISITYYVKEFLGSFQKYRSYETKTEFINFPSKTRVLVFVFSHFSILFHQNHISQYPKWKPVSYLWSLFSFAFDILPKRQAPRILPKKISRHPLPRIFPSCGAWPPTFHSSQGHLNVNYLSHGQRGRACLAQLLVNGSFLLFRLFIFSSSS